MKKILKIIIFILSCMLFLYSQNYLLKVSNYEINSNKISKEFNNFKIVQISDYHNENNKLLNYNLVNKIKKENPDIIVITGDLIDSNHTDIKTVETLIKKIKDIAPIYFIEGNHETWTSRYDELKELLEKSNIKILDNEIIELKKNEEVINLIGIKDYETSDEIIEKLNDIKVNREKFNILLSHRPEHFLEYVSNDIDLVLTGHTHGGQIRIFNRGLIAPNQGLLPKYTSGIIEEKNTIMITSRGIGNSIIPIRINNHPELVVITLKNKN